MKLPIKFLIITVIKQYVSLKKETVLKSSHENRHKSLLFDSYTGWHVETDLEHQLAFPTLTVQCPDIVI